ncbi:MAG: hypothetical protein WBP29_09040 [Candidatus Zixiibacteriota bacterium]
MRKITNHFKRLRKSAGFTITEVMIASIIASFAIAAGMELLINQNESHLTQAGVSDMQQNGRAVVDELVGKLRQTGYKLRTGTQCLFARNSNPDTLSVVFMAEPLCTATVSSSMSLPSSTVRCAGAALSCLQENSWAYIYDVVKDSGEFFYVTGVSTGTGDIQHSLANLSKAYPQGAKLMVLDFYKYYVNASDSLHPKLMMVRNGGEPEIYAENISDLQFKYVMANGTMFDTIVVDRYVRQVNISVVTRTEKRDMFVDGYRYDTLSSSAMIRNFSM